MDLAFDFTPPQDMFKQCEDGDAMKGASSAQCLNTPPPEFRTTIRDSLALRACFLRWSAVADERSDLGIASGNMAPGP